MNTSLKINYKLDFLIFVHFATVNYHIFCVMEEKIIHYLSDEIFCLTYSTRSRLFIAPYSTIVFSWEINS